MISVWQATKKCRESNTDSIHSTRFKRSGFRVGEDTHPSFDQASGLGASGALAGSGSGAGAGAVGAGSGAGAGAATAAGLAGSVGGAGGFVVVLRGAIETLLGVETTEPG